MRYVAAFSFVAGSLIGWLPECANAQSDPALDRLFLAQSQHQPTGIILSFNSVTGVDNYYGVGSEEAKLASEYFAGYNGSSAYMFFTRLPVLSARAHLNGASFINPTLAPLQTITDGSLTVTSQGYNYSAGILPGSKPIDLSHAKSFKDAASKIQAALNHTLPVAAVTTGSSIAPVSVSFTGSVNNLLLTVNHVSSGAIQVGGIISGAGIPANAQITSQIDGTPGGAGTYGLYVPDGHTATGNLTETYGVLTVGSTSGPDPVAIGQHVVGKGVLPDTAIEANLSGSGKGSTWLVNFAQTAESENMTLTGAPLQVVWTNVTGVNQKSGFFSIQQNGDFLYNSSSMSFAGGSTATTLGLTQAAGAFVTPEQLVPITDASLAAWMENLIAANPNDKFSTFQTTWDPKDFTPPGEQAALEAWAQSTSNPHYTYLQDFSANTSPIKNSMASSFAPAVAAPEPSTWVMALLGFAGLGLAARYRARRWTLLSGCGPGSAGQVSDGVAR